MIKIQIENIEIIFAIWFVSFPCDSTINVRLYLAFHGKNARFSCEKFHFGNNNKNVHNPHVWARHNGIISVTQQVKSVSHIVYEPRAVFRRWLALVIFYAKLILLTLQIFIEYAVRAWRFSTLIHYYYILLHSFFCCRLLFDFIISFELNAALFVVWNHTILNTNWSIPWQRSLWLLCVTEIRRFVFERHENNNCCCWLVGFLERNPILWFWFNIIFFEGFYWMQTHTASSYMNITSDACGLVWSWCWFSYLCVNFKCTSISFQMTHKWNQKIVEEEKNRKNSVTIDMGAERMAVFIISIPDTR